jgi:hypothetical protein
MRVCLCISRNQAGLQPLGPSRGIVIRLALLFSVDAFAGGLVVNALLSLWLMQRFGARPGPQASSSSGRGC